MHGQLAREFAEMAERLPDLDDTGGASRWPAWNGPIRELGVRSVLTSRVQTADRTVGFLTWYAETPHSFTPELITVAHLVALHTSEPLARSLERDHKPGPRAPRSTAPAIHHPASRSRVEHTRRRAGAPARPVRGC